MSEEKKEHKEGKKITVLNRSTKSYQTSVGWLAPNEAQEVPEAEAKGLLDYPNMVDAAKYVSPEMADAKLREENYSLKQEVADLKKQIEELKENKPKGKKKD